MATTATYCDVCRGLVRLEWAYVGRASSPFPFVYSPCTCKRPKTVADAILTAKHPAEDHRPLRPKAQPEPERGTAPKIEFFGPSGDGCHINVDGKFYAYASNVHACWKNALLRALTAPSPLPVREQSVNFWAVHVNDQMVWAGYNKEECTEVASKRGGEIIPYIANPAIAGEKED